MIWVDLPSARPSPGVSLAMESLIVIAPRALELDMKARIPPHFRVSRGIDGTHVIEGGSSRLYLVHDDSIAQDFAPAELREIESMIVSPTFYALDFSEIDFCRQIVCAIANDPRVLIDNDHGTRLAGDAFVRRWSREPDWDWRFER